MSRWEDIVLGHYAHYCAGGLELTWNSISGTFFAFNRKMDPAFKVLDFATAKRRGIGMEFQARNWRDAKIFAMEWWLRLGHGDGLSSHVST